MIALRDLTVRYGAGPPALGPVSLEVRAGERLAVIGESGSGKSTLARAIAGLLPPGAATAGRIDWQGGPPRPGRDYGFVFQDPGASFNPVISVGEQVAEVVRQHLGLGWRAAWHRAEELFARVRIPDPQQAVHAYAHQFSGGQRQRIAIAAAIAAGPRLLIADEATSALDMVVQAEIVALLDELVRDGGMTLLFITHDIALASGLADRIAVFREGRLEEMGDAAQVIGAPQSTYTRDLLAAHVALDSPPLIGGAA